VRIPLYLLVGLFFAFAYVAVRNLGGAPFFASGADATSARSLYFSSVTITTVGYGDYTARTNLGHTLSVTEALLGQIYLGSLSSRRSSAGWSHAAQRPNNRPGGASGASRNHASAGSE
jgi:hypothetical protein